MPGATGKEVVILDLYEGAGEVCLSREGTKNLNLCDPHTAKTIATNQINTKTLSGAPVTVMCDPTVVHFFCFNALGPLIVRAGDRMRRSRPTWGSNAGTVFSSQLQLGNKRKMASNSSFV